MYVKFVERNTGRTRTFEAVEIDAKPIEKVFITQPVTRFCFYTNDNRNENGKYTWTMQYSLYQKDGQTNQVFAGPGTTIYVMGDNGKTLDTTRLNK